MVHATISSLGGFSFSFLKVFNSSHVGICGGDVPLDFIFNKKHNLHRTMFSSTLQILNYCYLAHLGNDISLPRVILFNTNRSTEPFLVVPEYKSVCYCYGSWFIYGDPESAFYLNAYPDKDPDPGPCSSIMFFRTEENPFLLVFYI